MNSESDDGPARCREEYLRNFPLSMPVHIVLIVLACVAMIGGAWWMQRRHGDQMQPSP